ncbi:hypothetical protein DFH27DRAFT_235330 [Peziza echinospora]|nr:hypothetical protein DFH27DRAFT_235330 [Peziza echinospora]
MASPRQNRLNSLRSDLAENLRKGKESNRAFQDDTFDLSKATQKRPTAANARHTSDGSNGKPRKTTEQVPSRHRSSSAPEEAQPEDEDSSIASIGEIIPSKTRKASRSANLRDTRGPSLKAAMKAAETRDNGTVKRKSTNAASSNDVPKTFKSTQAFIQELGLDGHTATLNLQNPPTYDETLELTKDQNTNESFLLPNIGGISELIQQEATKIYNNGTASARKRNPHGQPPTHKPIESIPVPQDNRAILMALQLLQDQMASLKEQKSATEKRCEELKEQLKRMREKYENEHRRARVAEAESGKKRKTHTNINTDDTEAISNNAEEIERLKIAHLVEKTELENSITSYKTQIDEISHRAEITKIALRNMQDERNSAVNSAASAMASQKQLFEENERLREENNILRVERMQFESQVNSEREAWRAKEQILRKRVDKAREAESVAREAIHGLQKRLENGEKQRRKSVAANDTEELKSYFTSQYAPSTSTKNYNSRSHLAIHSAPATVTIPTLVIPPKSTHENTIGSPSKKSIASSKATKAVKDTPAKVLLTTKNDHTQQDSSVDTTYTVDGDYIRRIADEIEEERRRRKAAEKLAASSKAEMERIRQIVGTNNGKSVIGSSPTKKTTTPTSTSSKKAMASSSSNRDDNTTAVKSLPPRPVSAPPVVEMPAQNTTDHASKPKKRRIKKIVYYEDADTTEILPPPSASKSKVTEVKELAAPVFSKVTQTAPSSDDLDATFHTARKTQSVIKSAFTFGEGNTQTTALPPAPILPDHIRSVIDAEAEHDPLTCTVCTRKEMQNLQEESRKLSQDKGHGYDEASTLRPSRPADSQLSKVVRGLQDEFVHLKMAYQEKAEEFLSLDPSRGKRRRKEITAEINEMVAEMDWKCDMIYALYDVAEEVNGGKHSLPTPAHSHRHLYRHHSPTKGKSPQQVNFMDLHGFDSEGEQEEFEREIQVNGGKSKLVDVDAGSDTEREDHHRHDVVDSEEDSTMDSSTGDKAQRHHHHHHHHNNYQNNNNQQDLSLLDENDTTKDDDTNMEVARHLARQHQETAKQLSSLAGKHRHGRVEEVVDSYDEESTN